MNTLTIPAKTYAMPMEHRKYSMFKPPFTCTLLLAFSTSTYVSFDYINSGEVPMNLNNKQKKLHRDKRYLSTHSYRDRSVCIL